MEQWWRKNISEISGMLHTDADNGLKPEQIKQKQEQFGLNQLKEQKSTTALAIFLEQFNNFIIWILVGAALVSGFLKEWVDAVAIIAIVILNAILGFIQEYRAEKSLTALKKLSSPTSKIIRGGQHQVVPTLELVPGDIIELEAGDNVPADSRIAWHTSNFSAAEASLTGESTPVLKTSDILEEKDVSLAERANMVYLGTSIVSGKAKAVVVETGMQTELGKIAGMIQDTIKESTPLQKKLEQFGKWIVYICFFLVAMVFILELYRSEKINKEVITNIFLTSVSLAVAAIPEGLPAVVTIALALGVQRMVKRHAIIRKLPSVETLGCATVICSDKTGTLTKNEMTVQAVYAGGNVFKISGIGYAPKGDFLLDNNKINPADFKDLIDVLNIGVLCNGSQLVEDNGAFKIVGDPTEAALLTAAAKAGIWKDKKEKELPFIDEIPFDSQRKKMTIIRSDGKKTIAFVKGAPDLMLADCDQLTSADREEILKANNEMTDSAMRVLAVAYRVLDGGYKREMAESIEKNLTFAGLIAMIDPPREEVKKAIEQCKTSGIKTVMITGDHKNTAVAIAKELGFYGKDSLALSGEELDKMSNEELYEKIENIPVYARVAPEHKLRIVKAWRSRGEVAAMTGDGVNDAPAVKEADIGVAMGITGTDVTKEVSDMIITDDNFASIVSAIEEGRGIYDNILKFVHYLLSCNSGEVLVMFLASLLGLPVPLLPIHILWVNLITDGLPALALGVDPVSKDIMLRKPRDIHTQVITKKRLFLIIFQGFVISVCTLTAFSFIYFLENRWSLSSFFGAITSFDLAKLREIFTVPDNIKEEMLGKARTVCFVVLAFCQDFQSYNCRSQTKSLFNIGIFSNRYLVGATMVSMTLNCMAIYCPLFQKFLKTQPLTLPEILIVIFAASIPFWVMEIYKRLVKPKV